MNADAAGLKFVNRKRRIRSVHFESQSGTRILLSLPPMTFPNVVKSGR